MYYELDVTLHGKIIVSIIGLVFIGFIIWLVYRRKLSENLALTWISANIFACLLVNCNKMLYYAAKLSGIKTGALAVTMLALIFVFDMLIIFSVKLTSLTNQLRKLSQHVALMEVKKGELTEDEAE